jgi:hypothetical protein
VAVWRFFNNVIVKSKKFCKFLISLYLSFARLPITKKKILFLVRVLEDAESLRQSVAFYVSVASRGEPVPWKSWGGLSCAAFVEWNETGRRDSCLSLWCCSSKITLTSFWRYFPFLQLIWLSDGSSFLQVSSFVIRSSALILLVINCVINQIEVVSQFSSVVRSCSHEAQGTRGRNARVCISFLLLYFLFVLELKIGFAIVTDTEALTNISGFYFTVLSFCKIWR